MTDKNPPMPPKLIIESNISISEDEKNPNDDELSISNKPLEESQVKQNDIDSINLGENEDDPIPFPNTSIPNLGNQNLER